MTVGFKSAFCLFVGKGGLFSFLLSGSSKVQNVTVSDLDTQMFYLDFEAQDNGAQVIQVDINGLPDSWSSQSWATVTSI